ncbi:hypothetical protein AAIA72_02275 [Hahella sp. SMD15-11]|uniref:Uncharacterized protein n=1 Tax=Thermohahella caldifontis TaxID=3142973 RepID=A0AB39UWZ2_9GAMM
MLQDKLKAPVAQLNKVRDLVETEGKRVLKQLGADLDNAPTLADVVAQLREKNPDLKTLSYNLDAATYDLRERLKWNARMMAAYSQLQAEKAFEEKVKPQLQAYTEQLENQLRALREKAETVADKFTH